MLSGRNPFQRETWMSTSAALQDEPPPLRKIRPAIPLSLEHSVMRCLRKDPTRRFQNMADVKKVIRQFEARSETNYVSAISFALYYRSLGDADAVFKFLEAALADRDPYLAGIMGDPLLDAFRSDPHYRALLARMNLPDADLTSPEST